MPTFLTINSTTACTSSYEAFCHWFVRSISREKTTACGTRRLSLHTAGQKLPHEVQNTKTRKKKKKKQLVESCTRHCLFNTATVAFRSSHLQINTGIQCNA